MRVKKKPVEVEAVRFNGGSLSAEGTPFEQIYEIGTAFDEYPDWLESALENGNILTKVPYDFKIGIQTLEGTMWADAEDYIIKGVKNELYPCKPDVFDLTYDISEGTN